MAFAELSRSIAPDLLELCDIIDVDLIERRVLKSMLTAAVVVPLVSSGEYDGSRQDCE
jgi:hypothetical protein